MTDLPAAISLETRNPYERALWVATAVLIVGGIAGNVFAQFVFQNGYDFSSGSLPLEIIVAQSVASLAPGAFSGGLVCGALALTLRGIRFDRGRRSWPEENPSATADGFVEPDPAHAAVRSVPALPTTALGQRATSAVRPKPQAVDYTMYMRPEEPEEQPARRP